MQIIPKAFYSDFPKDSIRNGEKIVNKRGVIKFNNKQDSMAATIKDQNHKRKVEIRYAYNHKTGQNEVLMNCTCHKRKCEHQAATIIYQIRQGDQSEQQVDTWLNSISSESHLNPIESNEKKPAPGHFSIIYILFTQSGRLKVKVCVSRQLKTGGFGSEKPYKDTREAHQNAMTEIDNKIFFQLNWSDTGAYNSIFTLQSIRDEENLKKIIDTKRCFYQKRQNLPLTLGDPIEIKTTWTTLPNGSQKIVPVTEGNNISLFNLGSSSWYVNETHLGSITSTISGASLANLIDMPPIAPSQIKNAYKKLASAMPNLPEPITKIERPKADFLPTPILHFSKTWAIRDYNDEHKKACFKKDMIRSSPYEFENLDVDNRQLFLKYIEEMYRDEYYDDFEETEIITAKLSFQYGDMTVDSDSKDISFYKKHDNQLLKIDRNFPFEIQKEKELTTKFTLSTVNRNPSIYDCDDQYIDHIYIGDEQEAFEFAETTLPLLKEDGWKVSFDDNCTLEVFHDEDLEWFSELTESQYDWFGVNLGVMIDGEKVNLLPLIVKFLKDNNIYDASKIESDSIPIKTPKGQTILVPTERFKNILTVLTELYDNDSLNDEGQLELHNLSIASVQALQSIISTDNFTWLGSTAIREMGKKIKNFTKVEEVPLPSSFGAELRPYQQQGLNWLRFLREFKLGGLLADDMGLGKTIQTLACLAVEKETHPENPSLIISPTSLVANWQMEIEKFTPHLKTLVLHGWDRKKHFDDIQNYDLVLTSYPLVLRDKNTLLEHQFNYLILDEAQFIKNHRTKSSAVIFKLKANHKLCLSGTPMENHLGELWSQFRFLAPGLLGLTNKFKRLFATPIEKHQARDRRLALASRIKPFMLRRTKSEVAVDLPPKTEIIKTTSLEGKQRYLYESIRAAMDKKVRQAIQRQGLKKSHIIILDALLKLRQTCCDPRLLSISSAKAAHGQSSKLKLLMDMLPNMVEEGRKIILFSQFTSMIDLIKAELKQLDIPFVTLTGQTKDRKTPISQFQNGKVPIFIISLKAGGVGLNLTAADTVIHYDPWWNPAVENQATDRAHRIGQDKPVFVYKLITEGTVEETILDMQKKKRELVEGLLSENQNSKTQLHADDLKVLFRPIEHHAPEHHSD